jgi:phage N-6-adenine-methyltransferase
MSEPKQKPGRSKQDYGTPPEFLAALKPWFGIAGFDFDLAASHDNAVTDLYFTERDDALSRESWKCGDGYNWLNPPYKNLGAWTQRAWRELCCHRAQTLMLVPAAVGSNWWRDWVNEKARVRFLNPRLTFVGCKDPYPKDCALLIYDHFVLDDEWRTDFYDVWTWKPGKAHPAIGKSEDVSQGIGSAS